MQAITPPLATYTDEVLFGDVWKRTELGLRDRSLVTVAALIADGHTQQMTGHFNHALDGKSVDWMEQVLGEQYRRPQR